MYFRSIILSLILIFQTSVLSGQVKIRLFAGQAPGSVIFTVTGGVYEVKTYPGGAYSLKTGNMVVLAKYGDHLVIKIKGSEGLICDSASFSPTTGEDRFSLRISGKAPVTRFYSGELSCRPDLGTILLMNKCDIETYVAGVVRAEGGTGKNIEYFKAQAVLVRTYLFKYFSKHSMDHFNLCDDTHCQVFNGITNDSLIIKAAQETEGQVILGPDNMLIISAFHSNCGGETASSEDVWIAPQQYLKKVTDPFCTSSRNARWELLMTTNQWYEYLKRSGAPEVPVNEELLSFSQPTRTDVYKIGNFMLPLKQIRSDLKLRSTFFSVFVSGDSLLIKGKGYGHGVGLCQEGAMAMASKGYDYRQIINFYYTDVSITDINDFYKK